MPLTDHPADQATSDPLEERKFQADQEHQRAERAREDRRLQADLDHQRAERDREDKKLKLRYLAMAGIGPLSAGTLAFIGIVVVQVFSIIVEKRKFEGDVILHCLLRRRG